MVATSENGRKTAADAAQATQDAVWRYVDEWAGTGQTVTRAWVEAAHAGMKTVMQQQMAVLKATRTVVDATAQANREWLDQTVNATRTAHQAGMSMVDATSQMADAAMPWIKR